MPGQKTFQAKFIQFSLTKRCLKGRWDWRIKTSFFTSFPAIKMTKIIPHTTQTFRTRYCKRTFHGLLNGHAWTIQNAPNFIEWAIISLSTYSKAYFKKNKHVYVPEKIQPVFKMTRKVTIYKNASFLNTLFNTVSFTNDFALRVS